MRALVLSAALLLSACGGGEGGSDGANRTPVNYGALLAKVAEQRQLWVNRDIKNYLMVYYFGVTGCPTIDKPMSIQVTVVDGKVQSANYVETGQFIAVDGVKTIDQLFDLTVEQINKSPVSVGYDRNSAEPAAFDAYFGFPSQIFFDFRANDQCDDVTLKIRQFS